jgi:cell division protein ZapA
MSNQVSIKVQIGKRDYKTLVSKEEVHLVQQAEQKLNEILKEYDAKYNIEDIRDLLAMAALYFATETVKKQGSKELSETEMAKLDEANELLGKYLASL